MKIIKHGNTVILQRKKYLKFECDHCGCVYEVEKSEIQTTNDETSYKFTTCPECGKHIPFVGTT